MGAKAIQLSHVNITVSDVKQAEEFYLRCPRPHRHVPAWRAG